ncbi:MAG: glycosyltransferase family 39 protein [Patescibacteria group bacterium]
MKKTTTLLFIIFALAVTVRFLFFPDNVYFGFDQARDAFESLSIYKNLDLKIIGPSTASPTLFHGPLYWYLIGPFYLLGKGNPAVPAAFLLTLNALGIFLIYLTGKILFNKRVGLISGLLYAVSFEQTQYAMYFGNPAPAVLTIILFYLGLAFFFFKDDVRGGLLALFALGLSIQFEFFLFYLILVFVFLMIILGRRKIKTLQIKEVIFSAIAFLVPLLTFILAEIKFGFRTTKSLLSIFTSIGGSYKFQKAATVLVKRMVLEVNDNIFSFGTAMEVVILLALLGFSLYLLKRRAKDYKKIEKKVGNRGSYNCT